jgi:predicted Zn-dependent peptidase
MGRLGRSVVQEGRATTVDEQVAAITAVTREDVHRVLRRVFEGPRALAAVAPDSATGLDAF